MYQTMEKSEAYRRPARIKVVTMFFKNEHEKLHRERKKIWATLFTPSGYALLHSSSMPFDLTMTWQANGADAVPGDTRLEPHAVP